MPTNQTVIGHVIRVTNRGKEILAKDNSWQIETDYEESVDCQIQINKVLSQLEGKEDILMKIYHEYDVEIILMIVSRVENWTHPCLDLNAGLVKYLAGINAIIRYDQYYYDDNLPDSYDEFNYTSEYKITLMIERKENDLDSKEVSNRLGIKQRIFQDKAYENIREYNKDVVWKYEFSYDKSFEITHTLDSLVEIFDDKRKQLYKICEENNAKVILLISLILKNGDYPCTNFSRRHIEFLSSINSSVQFERHYVYSPNDFVVSKDN